MGLIELISNEGILKNVDADDKNADGISGQRQIGFILILQKEELGRYTWKASVYSLKEQVRSAANNDMGLTTTLFI